MLSKGAKGSRAERERKEEGEGELIVMLGWLPGSAEGPVEVAC